VGYQSGLEINCQPARGEACDGKMPYQLFIIA